MDWIDLTQGRERWQALEKTVLTCGFHKTQEISGLAEEQSASQEVLCFMEILS
jgi:hypothetical protein